MRNDDAGEIRSEFIAAQKTILTTTDGATIAFDPDLDLHRVLQLATSILNLWPQNTPYDAALHLLASATSALIVDPSTATRDAWRMARAEHADALNG
jgi:hypothetical protein